MLVSISPYRRFFEFFVLSPTILVHSVGCDSEESMTPLKMTEWLDEMLDISPNEYSGEEAYLWLHSRVERMVKDGREEFIGRGTDLVVVSIGIKDNVCDKPNGPEFIACNLRQG